MVSVKTVIRTAWEADVFRATTTDVVGVEAGVAGVAEVIEMTDTPVARQSMGKRKPQFPYAFTDFR